MVLGCPRIFTFVYLPTRPRRTIPMRLTAIAMGKPTTSYPTAPLASRKTPVELCNASAVTPPTYWQPWPGRAPTSQSVIIGRTIVCSVWQACGELEHLLEAVIVGGRRTCKPVTPQLSSARQAQNARRPVSCWPRVLNSVRVQWAFCYVGTAIGPRPRDSRQPARRHFAKGSCISSLARGRRLTTLAGQLGQPGGPMRCWPLYQRELHDFFSYNLR